MTPDQVNGLFEFLGAIFILNHCRVLYKAKKVSGVSILSTEFFFAWGLWNIHYYPLLGQVWSYRAGICVALANALWIALMIYYDTIKGRMLKPTIPAFLISGDLEIRDRAMKSRAERLKRTKP